MALRKTIGLLPEIFRTDRNEKFLNATLDQLVTPESQEKMNGFIGRTFAPSYSKGDGYINEPSLDRQNYQLEPGVVFETKPSVGDPADARIEFLSSYTDIVNRVGFSGGYTNDHDRLFQNEYYNWASFFDFDKFVNFSQYYWLPNGPDSVQVFNSVIDTEVDWNVTRVDNELAYHVSNHNSVNNPALVCARGGTYTLNVNQLGHSLWIQTEPGTDGIKDIQRNLSTREVFGVQNNGDDVGTITLNIPEANAQNHFITMTRTADVDFATRLTYNDVQRKDFTAFIAANPTGFDGITEQRVIENATIVFYSDTLDVEGQWEQGGLFDATGAGYDASGSTFDPTVRVPLADRYDVYTINIDSDNIMNLSHTTDIPSGEKVFITRGEEFGNLELWKDPEHKLAIVPVITAPLNRLYYQDGSDETRFGIIDIVDAGTVPQLDVERDIIGQSEYISVNHVEFTNGMKVEFNSDATPAIYADREFYVEGVGNSIILVPVDELIIPEPFTQTEQEGFDNSPYGTTGFAGSSNAPTEVDYLTINRGSKDRNAWSRSNRWTHIDVIKSTAQYNSYDLVLDQTKRANRPIIEFEPNLELYNYGRVHKSNVSVIDTTQVDAFSNVEGQAGYYVDGVPLETGMRVIWTADADASVRAKIYEVTITDPQNDGLTEIHMTEVAQAEQNDSIINTHGIVNQGLAYWYNGSTWVQSQQKTTTNQSPYFNIFDVNKISFGDDTAYLGSGFTGTKLFSYQIATGIEDPVLGIPLSYKNFENVGDIIFENNYARDKFTYSPVNAIETKNVNDGFVNVITDRSTVTIKNDWVKCNTSSRQYQVIEYTVQDELQTFEIGVAPKTEIGPINLYVYKNSQLLLGDTTQNITNNVSTDYTTSSSDGNFFITLNVPAAIGDQIVIRVYADTQGKYGYYEIPKNLENNAQNADFTTLTLGQIRNHVTEMGHGMSTFIGNAPGANNFRDLNNVKSYPGKILQHSAGAYLSAFLNSSENTNFKLNTTHVHNNNFMNAIEYSQKEYTKFKNKFNDAISELDLDFNDIPGSVDACIAELKIGKTETFPFFYSDMIGYGSDNNTTEYTVSNPNIKTYDYGIPFDNTVISNRSLLVYLNGTQLYHEADYAFDTLGANITLTDNIVLSIGDAIKIVDFNNTDGSHIPPTPTKMGMYKKFKPEIYLDDTYRTPTNVIQGHDGSVMVAYNDSRDDLILELERRIYNNIKTTYNASVFDLNDIMPGKFRTTRFTRDEVNSVLSLNFLNWATLARIDNTSQIDYDVTDKFTWNYSNFSDVGDGELLPGYWRGVYRHYYDTDRPHTHPWEMLGLSEKPAWWDGRYGLPPYTKGNDVMWENLRDGKLFNNAYETDHTVLPRYVRPNLMDIIPVDANGELVPPLVSVVKAYNTTYTDVPYVFGDVGPAESAWRRSSEYPFALQKLAALSNPATFYATRFDTTMVTRNTDLDQIINVNTSRRLQPSDLLIHGTATNNVVTRVNGISQFIADYATHRGVNIQDVQDSIQGLEMKLMYRMAGYSDKKFLKVLAEQVSPNSTNKGIFVPDEDYVIELTKSSPLSSASMSGVIVTKNTNGWSVSGYDLEQPYFDVIPSVITDNNHTITGGTAVGVVYHDSENAISRVPYNTEFTTHQQMVDFFVSYQRYLELQGFIFDEKISEDAGSYVKDWILSAKEFLFWQTQGWVAGSSITLNPVSDKVKFEDFNTIPDHLSQDTVQYRILNENFRPIRYNQMEVSRIDNYFTLQAHEDAGLIFMVDISPVQYEHTIVFNNTTVFNDVLYQPELGSRQYRLKLVGTKTSNWDGTFQAPGYIYNIPTVDAWQAGKDYKKGDFVKFRKLSYVAVQDQDALQIFDQTYWKKADNIKTGLLPNLDTKIKSFGSFYDVDNVNLESETDKFGKGIIGYQRRDYLENLELDDVSQVKFYQGMIQQKGTSDSINKLVRAKLDNMDSNINYFEEWAFRLGAYGAVDSNQVIEVSLDETEFKANPELIEFLDNGDTRPQHISYIEDDLYKTPNLYTKNLFNNRSAGSNTKLDISGAGFPRLGDVDATVFDIDNVNTLSDNIDAVGSGYTIWTAKNPSNVWDVYRVSETFAEIEAAEDVLDNRLMITTSTNHVLSAGEFIAIRGVNATINGFYKVDTIVSNTQFVINVTQIDTALTGLTGILYKLESVKFNEPSDISTYTPKLGWQDGEIVWMEADANNKWQVLQKNSPWDFTVNVPYDGVVTNTNFGTNFSSANRNLWAVAGVPASGTGLLVTYVKTVEDDFVQNSVYDPSDVSNISGLGNSVSAGNDVFSVAGASASNGGTGYAVIYKKDSGNAFSLEQVLCPAGLTSTSAFGTDVSISDDEKWIYVSAPGDNTVYAYALDEVNGDDETVVSVLGDDVATSMTLFWFPVSVDAVQVIDDFGRVYVPNVDYTVSGSDINFTFTMSSTRRYIARRKTLYREIDTITPSDQIAGDAIGTVLSTNEDGTTIIIGAPVQDISGVVDAGSTYVYARGKESFYADGSVAFTTTGTIGSIMSVYVSGVLQTYLAAVDPSVPNSYTYTGNVVTFSNPPSTNSVIEVEVNDFTQTQKLTSSVPTDTANFGTSVQTNANANFVVIGSPGEDENNPNTGSAFVYIDQMKRYGSITGSVPTPTVTAAHKLQINGIIVTLTGSTLTQTVQDINDANIVGITASDVNDALVITSDSKIAGSKLSVLPSTGTALTDLGLEPFVLTQSISHPSGFENENFGKTIAIDRDSNFLVIGSDRASTIKTVKFDVNADNVAETYFDQHSTKWFDKETQSGAVYVYDLLPSTSETISNPAQYALVEQLQSDSIASFNQFGASVHIRNNKIVVGSPKYDKSDSVTDSGILYEFNNPSGITGWTPFRSEGEKVDVSLINKAFIYNQRTNEIIEYLDWVDPFKGKIAGVAQQEINYVIERDPANYNISTNPTTTLNTSTPWNHSRIGEVWWDVSTVRYVEYEQGDLDYRSQHWGQQFPGSSIDVYEWVESSVLPSQYAGPGTPKHPDDSSYVVDQKYIKNSNTIVPEYYFWVKNKDTVPNKHNRKLDINTVSKIIDNPKTQGIFHLGVVKSNAVIAYNIANLLENQNVLLHINYDVIENSNILHSEYQLLSEGDASSVINDQLYTKFVDSLTGSNANGDSVPQRELSLAERYGVLNRPRQTMFANRETAVQLFVTFCNSVFANYQIANQFDLTRLESFDPLPGTQSGLWDETVQTYAELTYLIPAIYPNGYNVLIEADENNDNLWTIYTKTSNNTWSLTRVQAYDTSRYWNKATWYNTGYTDQTSVSYAVETEADLSTLVSTLKTGELVKIKSSSAGGYSIVEYQADGTFTDVIVENATIELSQALYDPSIEATGFDNSAFSNSRFSQQPVTELRQIIEAVKNDIFIEDLRVEFNNLWFTMIEYLLTEQPYADWLFKTSFIKVIQKLRGLDQYPNFQRDNQDYIKDYINEVKPYRTNVREYVLQYTKDEPWDGDPTDFDVHSYYDADADRYRKPSGEQTGDTALWNQGLNQPFGQNYTYELGSVVIVNSGTGYIDPPILTVNGNGTGATVEAKTNGSSVLSITVTNPGSGYTETPTITIDGNGTGLEVYPQLINNKVREFTQTLKFDRYTYSSNVITWTANTSYTTDDIVTYLGEAYIVTSDFTSSSTFDATSMEIYADENFLNAADRIAAFYQPTSGMIGNDLAQLQLGTEYAGVKIYGPDFSANPGFDVGSFDVDPYDSFEIDSDGIVVISGASALDATISSTYLDANLGLAAEDIVIDGSAYVDVHNSHSPEEFVPGMMFDSLDMKVYTINNQDREYDGNGMRIFTHYYTGDGVTTEFNYSNQTELQDVDNLFVWTTSGALYETTDYTVNYTAKVVTLNNALPDGDKVYIYSFGNAGERPVLEYADTGDGTTSTFTLSMDPTQVTQSYVLVDGVEVIATLAANGTSKVDVVLPAPPALNAHIHIMLFDLDVSRTAATAVDEQIIVSDGSLRVHTLDNTVRYTKPFAANTIVEVNGVRLRPDNVAYYTGDGSTLEFNVPTSAGEVQGLINNADIRVGVINDSDANLVTPLTNKVSGVDYTIVPYDGVSTRSIVLTGDDPAVYTPDVNDTVIVGITTDAEYSISSDGTTLTIDPSVTLANNDVIRIITFANHDPVRLQTNVFKGTGDTLPGQRFTLDRPVTNTDHLWVTVDGVKLHSAEDYYVDGSTIVIGNNNVLTSTSIVVVSSFTENIMGSATGFRIFKDMLNNFEYYRIAGDNITTLSQDLLYDDTTIYVSDSSVLPTPDITGGTPGVIIINRERITYWAKDNSTNTLTGIRRSTAGTGSLATYSAGEAVHDVSGQLIPGDTHTLSWYTRGAGDATDGLGLQNSDTIQAEYLNEKKTLLPS